MGSVMPEDAEVAEFFGKVVKVEIAKPKKKGMNVNCRIDSKRKQ